MPLYPSKVLQARECALIPCSSVVLYLGLTFESLKELGAHQVGSITWGSWIISNLPIFVDLRINFAMLSLCYAQHPRYFFCIMFPFPGIL
jgi:hypothetical protein